MVVLPPLAAELLGRCRFPIVGTPVTAAVSGGADSMALLVLARVAGLNVTAVHVDHGLRPGSAQEADLVRAAARRWGAGFESRQVSVGPGANVEARARAARYGALPPGVMTGHTADDQAETVLLHLLRGAGLDGLRGMTDSPRVTRPLLDLRHSETRALCDAVGVVPAEDPSNDDPAFRRNQVRHRLLPLMGEIAARDVVPVLVRQGHLLADDAALLDALAEGLDPTDAAALARAPLPLARRAVRAWLRAGADGERHPPSAAEVARVMTVATGDAVACQIAGGRRVRRSGGRLRIDPQ